MNKIRKYKELIIFLIVITTNLVCLCVPGMVSVIITWAVTICYGLYVLVTAYRHRKRYYFVSFFADGKPSNASIAVRHSLRIRKVEDFLSDMAGAKSAIIMTFRRISRKQYKEMTEWNVKQKED